MATFETPPTPGSSFPTAGKTLTGTSVNETFTGGSGNDIVNGGGGTDTLVFTGTRADHTISLTGTVWTVSSTADGTDSIQNIERLQFSDVSYALDVSGVAGQAYRLYQAAFNRTPDAPGLGYWISVLDSGEALASAAQGFVTSPEFVGMYGTNPTNFQIVTKFYDNVLHRAPDQGGFNYWVDILDRGLLTVAGVLAEFGESPENQAAMVGVISNGFSYNPFGG